MPSTKAALKELQKNFGDYITVTVTPSSRSMPPTKLLDKLRKACNQGALKHCDGLKENELVIFPEGRL